MYDEVHGEIDAKHGILVLPLYIVYGLACLGLEEEG